MFLKNRQVTVSLSKTPAPGTDGAVACNHPSTEQILEIAEEKAMDLARLVAIAYVGKKLVDTACQIAVITAQAKLK